VKKLLARVHKRLGGLGVDIQTFGETGHVEIRWRRDYGDGSGISDQRCLETDSIGSALRGVLEWEDVEDAKVAAEIAEHEAV
jgi:hypothetical protein